MDDIEQKVSDIDKGLAVLEKSVEGLADKIVSLSTHSNWAVGILTGVLFGAAGFIYSLDREIDDLGKGVVKVSTKLDAVLTKEDFYKYMDSRRATETVPPVKKNDQK